MARKSYEVDGVLLWDFATGDRSKINPRVRVQRKRTGIPLSAEEAEKYEQSLWRECVLEVARLEGQGLTWEELFEKWDHYWMMNPSKRWSDETRRDIYARLRNWTKLMHKKFARQLIQADVEDCLRLAEFNGASFRVRREIRRSIDTVYRWAMDQKFIVGKEFSPCRNILIESEKPEDNAEKIPLILTREEIKTLLGKAREVNHPWYPIWFFALYTGMRTGEINALRKQKIDFVPPTKAIELDRMPELAKKNYGRIKVQLSWEKRLGRNGPTKGRWWRTVPINSKLYWFLHEHLKTAQFGSDADGERVFPKLVSWDRSEQAKVLKDFCRTYGLKEITFHTLRACFATQMFEAGADIATVMKIGGWKDIKTMMFYVRVAGIEEVGKTESLDFGETPPSEEQIASFGNVVNLFKEKG
jgi:integrase